MHLVSDDQTFRGLICPRCLKQFFICPCCYRGHVYCCGDCSLLSRQEKCRKYRKKYREDLGEEGRKDRRDAQRERRRLKAKSVEDHSSAGDAKPARVSVQTRKDAILVTFCDVGMEADSYGDFQCEFCGKRSNLVCFGNPRQQTDSKSRARLRL